MKILRYIAIAINLIILAISIRAVYLTFVVESPEEIILSQQIGFSALGFLAIASLLQILKRFRYTVWPVIGLNSIALFAFIAGIAYVSSLEPSPVHTIAIMAMLGICLGTLLNIASVKLIPNKAF